MIHIEQCQGCGNWQLFVRDELFLKTAYQRACEVMAQRLDRARNANLRGGMRILCEEIGMDEEAAKELYLDLRGH